MNYFLTSSNSRVQKKTNIIIVPVYLKGYIFSYISSRFIALSRQQSAKTIKNIQNNVTHKNVDFSVFVV